MDDGKLQFKVKDIANDKIKTEVIVGGYVKSNKGINLPDVVLLYRIHKSQLTWNGGKEGRQYWTKYRNELIDKYILKSINYS